MSPCGTGASARDQNKKPRIKDCVLNFYKWMNERPSQVQALGLAFHRPQPERTPERTLPQD